MAKYQLQRRISDHADEHDDRTGEWRDIVTVPGSRVYGPGSREQAMQSLRDIRGHHPDTEYRVVKLIKEQ